MPRKKERISIEEAVEIAASKGFNIGYGTMRNWVIENRLGEQVGGKGKWFVDKAKLLKFLNGRT